MNLHALRFFVKVAETGSVTLASEALRVSQPAVTAQIKRLEHELGLQLWIPHGRGVALTEAGRMLAGEAKRLFELEHSIEDGLERLKKGEAGQLHIAATYLPSNFLLPRPIAAYKKLHPSIGLDLTTSNSSHALELLLHFKADIAIVGGIAEEHPLLERTPWLEDEMCFVVHPDHPLAGAHIPLAEILREPFIIREEGSFSREQLLALCKIHNLPAPAIGLQMNGLHETLRVVMEGYGAAFLSTLETEAFMIQSQLSKVHVQHATLKNPISIYTRKEPLSPAARQFFDGLQLYS
ncbi:LysR family transcriptional regulator [Paenibacillus dokdonensis]|uniref:LysR family transcriptional regulator n=1 Tax=Paenibacillus dokdonensis TaxID=2567944 RepID=A0ABU6GVI2_9BACL|nr:LysR family transcriptional regulator [Paenibacillus dokdonensis]MEC0242167.1 LysR family transcriptional regulator [Paenibacillus dokdonensis]